MRQNPDTKMPDKVYKVYTAIATQSDTDVIGAVVMNSNIGTPIWSKVDVGQFYVTADEPIFTENKTIVTALSGTGGFIYGTRVTDYAVAIYSKTIAGAFADFYIYNTGIEIRIYS